MPNLIVNTPTQSGNQVTVTGTTDQGVLVQVLGPGGAVLGSGTSDSENGTFSITFTVVGDSAPASVTVKVPASGKSLPTALSQTVSLASAATGSGPSYTIEGQQGS